jgi:glutathione S-transferase
MIKIYGASFSRASIVQWYLEELNVPYEFISLDMKAGEHRQAEYLAINPTGKVPSIVDGDFQLWESGAILLYLAEKYGNLSTNAEEKAQFTKWLFYANSTLLMGIFIEKNREVEMPKLLPPLNDLLSKQSFLVGDSFSVADIAVGSVLYFVPLMLKLNFDDYPAIADYMQRLSSRPAFVKAMNMTPAK